MEASNKKDLSGLLKEAENYFFNKEDKVPLKIIELYVSGQSVKETAEFLDKDIDYVRRSYVRLFNFFEERENVNYNKKYN